MATKEESEATSAYVTLVVDGQWVARANRAMLVTRSPFFAAMFGGNFSESRQDVVELRDVSAEAVQFLVDETRATLNQQIGQKDLEWLLDLLQTCGMLQFDEERVACLRAIVDRLDEANALRVLSVAQHLDEERLAERAKCWSLWHLTKAINALKDVSATALATVLAHDGVNASEEQVLSTIIQWTNQQNEDEDEAQTLTALAQLLQCVRWTNVTPDQRGHFGRRLEKELATPETRAAAASFVATVESSTCHDQRGGPRRLPYQPTVVGRLFRNEPHLFRMENVVKKDSSHTFDQVPRPWMSLDMCGGHTHLEGHKVVSTGPYLFVSGGEFSMGKGQWNHS
jgi:hypothetical protein